jgi:hypothetical protein
MAPCADQERLAPTFPGSNPARIGSIWYGINARPETCLAARRLGFHAAANVLPMQATNASMSDGRRAAGGLPDPGARLGRADRGPAVGSGPRRPHEPVRRDRPVRGRRAGDLGHDALGRPALEPSAAALRERHRPAGRGAGGGVPGRQPSDAGAIVVYGSAYGVFGHIATVRAVRGDRYEVAEQNFLDFNPHLEPHWATFDLRSVAWPDPAVVGFVVAPRVG